MRVCEIFYSIQGEGVYTGIPMVFIRLAGCNLIPHCAYCDTDYAWKPESGEEMETEDVMKKVTKLSPHYKSWVCITGGEPLWQLDELEKLVRELKRGGYLITIETNGSFKPPSWYTLVDSWNADIKCPSSQVCGTSSLAWFNTRQCDQIKLVVGNMEDLDFARNMINKHKVDNPIVMVSPMSFILSDKIEGKISEYWSKDWLKEVAEFCKEMRVRYSLQLHKAIWGSKRGV